MYEAARFCCKTIICPPVAPKSTTTKNMREESLYRAPTRQNTTLLKKKHQLSCTASVCRRNTAARRRSSNLKQRIFCCKTILPPPSYRTHKQFSRRTCGRKVCIVPRADKDMEILPNAQIKLLVTPSFHTMIDQGARREHGKIFASWP